MQNNPDLFTAVSPIISLNGGLKFGNKSLDDEYRAFGVSDSFIDIFNIFKIEQGRWIQYMDNNRLRKVCVVGSNLVDNVIVDDVLNKKIKIYGEDYDIIGSLEYIVDDINDWNNAVFLPYTKAELLIGSSWQPYTYFDGGGYWDNFYLSVTDSAKLWDARLAIRSLRDELVGREESMLGIFTLDDYSKMAISSHIMIILMLAICTVIVMLVSGVGLANTMLLIVRKRTMEIGIRKAFGATQRDIKQQFLLESIYVSLIGGIIGILLGVPLSYIACKIIGLPFKFFIIYIVLALVFSAGFALIFGTYPAQQAAKLEIVDAINSD